MANEHLMEDELNVLRAGGDLARDRLEHAEDCPRCQAWLHGFENTWLALGDAVPESERDLWPDVAAAIQPPTSDWVKRGAWAAAAVVVVAVGVWGVSRMGRLPGSADGPTAVTADSYDPSQSPARRLAAVLAMEVSEPEAGSSRHLLDALAHDPDEHVRIAALDAIGPAILEGDVESQKLLAILERERSPLVQSDLIELLLRTGAPDIVAGIRRVLPPETTHPLVLDQLPARTPAGDDSS